MVETGESLDIGLKNGFCVLENRAYDSVLAQTGYPGYDCNLQGMNPVCYDKCNAGLQ